MPTVVPLLAPDQRPRRRPSVSVERALASATRAGIYAHLREADEPCSVRDIAAHFDLHPNVARTHLETLADAGLCTVGRRKHPGGGRPAKVYASGPDAPDAVPAPAGGPDPATLLLVDLLAALLDDAAHPPGTLLRRATDVAAQRGQRLAADAGVRRLQSGGRPALEDAVRQAVAVLRPVASGARVVAVGEGWVDVVGVRGLFAAAEEARPELADALERGLLLGALTAAGVLAVLADAGTAEDGAPAWRVRPAGGGARAGIAPAASVDARGRAREAAVVHAMRTVTVLRRGDVLEVLAEGPGSPAAFARWADRAGHELLAVERHVDPDGRPAIRLLIRKGAA